MSITKKQCLLTKAASLVLLCFSHAYASAKDVLPGEEEALHFYDTVMSASPILPANLKKTDISCSIAEQSTVNYFRSAKQVNYSKPGWESRVSADWSFFAGGAENGRITVIDFRQQEKALSYRYLSNGKHDERYEPWSSSKVFAYTGAVAKARVQGVGGMSKVGDFAVPDLITSVNSYDAFGSADGDSNAIASYFVNLAGREYLTALFHDKWLALSDSQVFFRGAYGSKAFDPGTPTWQQLSDGKSAQVRGYMQNADDPGYLPYRCEQCGLTGNKPMTTLAQAEWLKRLAVHERDTLTQHPELHAEDISVLFYGIGHTQKNAKAGGMLAGISRMLSHAIARHISGDPSISDEQAKQVLDKATLGEWRIFQKIGWGPSETRGTGENVMLAHVCLPYYQGGREFTLAAQASFPEVKTSSVGYSGMKMQRLLDVSMAKLLIEQ